jgi:hypothetical protein
MKKSAVLFVRMNHIVIRLSNTHPLLRARHFLCDVHSCIHGTGWKDVTTFIDASESVYTVRATLQCHVVLTIVFGVAANSATSIIDEDLV